MDKLIVFVGVIIEIVLGITLLAVEIHYRHVLLDYFRDTLNEKRKRANRKIIKNPQNAKDELNNIVQKSREVAFMEAIELIDEEDI